MDGFGNIWIFDDVLLFYAGELTLTDSRFFFVFRFDNLRVPRENLLNSVADVLPDGRYVSAIKNPDQVIVSM